MEYPRGASVISVVHFHACLSLKLGQTSFYRFSHANPNSNMLLLESNKARNLNLLSYYKTKYGKGGTNVQMGILTSNVNLNYYIIFEYLQSK